MARFEVRPNVISPIISTGFGFDNDLFYSFGMEYRRYCENNSHWALQAAYTDTSPTEVFTLFSSRTYEYAMPKIISIGGRFYHDMHVNRRVAFRVGAGFDLTYHIMHLDKDKHLGNKLVPFFTLNAKWVIYAGPYLDIEFPLLIVNPSSFSITPSNYGRNRYKNMWLIDFEGFKFLFRF